MLEFDIGGNTLWVHSKDGTSTVLRLKTKSDMGILITPCDSNPCSHVDAIVDNSLRICVAKDASVL